MTTVLEVLCAVFVLGGTLFSVIGGIGMVRFPTFYTRCHAAGMTDSAGAAGVLLGLCFVAEPLVAVKLISVLAFIWLTSVASTHALVKAAYARGIRFYDEQPLDFTNQRQADRADASEYEAPADAREEE